MTEENETQEAASPAQKIDDAKGAGDESQVNAMDGTVAKRLMDEASQGAQDQAEKDNLKPDDPSRAISLGELRKLIAEINGSFDRVSNFLETSGSQIAQNLNSIHALHARISKVEQKLGINYMDMMPGMDLPKEDK